jgi:hypothetical protein
MWQGKLAEVTYDLNKTVDTIKLTVELTDGTRTTTKEYLIYIDELSEVTASSLKAKIQLDIDRLDKMDKIYNLLLSKIGKVL